MHAYRSIPLIVGLFTISATLIHSSVLVNEYKKILGTDSRPDDRYFLSTSRLLDVDISVNGINSGSFHDYLYILKDFSSHNLFSNHVIADRALVIQSEDLIKLFYVWQTHAELQTKEAADCLDLIMHAVKSNLIAYSINNYKPRSILIDVPRGGFTGINPDYIEDPAEKARYKRELADQYDVSIDNNLQLMIRRFSPKIEAAYSSFLWKRNVLGI